MDELHITEADVGKLFKTRDGDVRKVIYIHSYEGCYPGPVVAINTDTGRAFNFQLNGWFLRSEASEYDLVERYEPMSWEKFCKDILKWSTDRGIIANSTSKEQALKGLAEFGRLAEAYLNKDEEDSGLDIVGMCPQYKLVHGVKVPVFPDWEPALGETVFVVDVTHVQFFYEQEWIGDELDLMYLDRGLVYPAITKGERAAELHSKAMLGITEDNDAIN